jgi:hypothetical protein
VDRLLAFKGLFSCYILEGQLDRAGEALSQARLILNSLSPADFQGRPGMETFEDLDRWLKGAQQRLKNPG